MWLHRPCKPCPLSTNPPFSLHFIVVYTCCSRRARGGTGVVLILPFVCDSPCHPVPFLLPLFLIPIYGSCYDLCSATVSVYTSSVPRIEFIGPWIVLGRSGGSSRWYVSNLTRNSPCHGRLHTGTALHVVFLRVTKANTSDPRPRNAIRSTGPLADRCNTLYSTETTSRKKLA